MPNRRSPIKLAKWVKLRKAARPNGSRVMSPPGLQIHLRPHVTLTLTFDLLSKGRPFRALARWNSCANLHQNLFICFQNIMFTSLVTDERTDNFFLIRLWYLRCCGCPWNRGWQHLATPLKTCQNIEVGFLKGWLLCLSPNSDVTASDTSPFPHLGCVPAVVPAKGGSSA